MIDKQRADFEARWRASKYMQVVYSDASAEQTAWEAWQARAALTQQEQGK